MLVLEGWSGGGGGGGAASYVKILLSRFIVAGGGGGGGGGSHNVGGENAWSWYFLVWYDIGEVTGIKMVDGENKGGDGGGGGGGGGGGALVVQGGKQVKINSHGGYGGDNGLKIW